MLASVVQKAIALPFSFVNQRIHIYLDHQPVLRQPRCYRRQHRIYPFENLAMCADEP